MSNYDLPDFYDRAPVPETLSVLDDLGTQLLVLELLLTRGIGPKTIARVVADLDLFLPREVSEFPDDILVERYGISRELVLQFREERSNALRLLHELQDEGVVVLVAGARDYPGQLSASLAISAPPVLFALGDLTLLSAPGVGFCGARDASPRALAAVEECARDLARQRINVVSGYAHGVDITAHQAALEADGITTVVLAEGIRKFKLKREIAKHGMSNVLVLSQFPPDASWNAGNAMSRNWTICSVTDAMVVVESRLEGGTFAAGKAALELGRPLYVIDYGKDSAPGNAYFLDKGAKPLRRRPNGSAATERLVDDALRQALIDERVAARHGTHVGAFAQDIPRRAHDRPRLL